MSFRLSVLDQSPIAEGSTGADALRNSIDLAQCAERLAITATGWPSITARRCWRAPARRSLIGAIAAATGAHPGRQRRRDAAALQPAQGRRDVQHAERAASRSHRSRRSAARRAPIRSPRLRCSAIGGSRRRTTFRSSSPNCSPTLGSHARRSSVRAARRAARPARAARRLAARIVSAKRRSGPPSSDCRTPLPTSSTRGAHAIAAATGDTSRRRSRLSGAAGDRRRLGALRRHRRRGRAARVEQPAWRSRCFCRAS